MKMINSLRWAISIVLLLASASVIAVEKAGQILFARGVVSIVDADESARGGSSGSPIYEGDRIITGSNSIAQIHLTDGTMIGLRSNSDYLLEKQRYDSQQDADAEVEEESVYEQAGQLFSGWMRMVTGAIGKRTPGNVRQRTTVATIGIRGTVYQLIHIPPEGLPELPNEEPGTYLLLEQGSLDMFSDGGVRTVRPGQVVFVPANGSAPRRAPLKKQLFERLEKIAEGNTEELDRRQIARRIAAQLGETDPTIINDAVDSFLNTNVAPFTNVAMISAYGTGQKGGSSSSETIFGKSAEVGVYPVAAKIEGPQTTEMLVNQDQLPVDTGYYQVKGQGTNVASEVYWGRFDPAQYFQDRSPASSEWHYMLASQVIYDLATINSNFPAGQLFYTYVGGTSLTGSLGNSSVLVIDSGSMDINLLTLDMFFELVLADSGSPLVDTVSGSGTIGDFVGTGLSISGTTYSGSVLGGFVGNGLQGAISAVTLTSGSEDYLGTALFEQESGSLLSAPNIAITNKRAFTSGFARFGLAANQSVLSLGSGANRRVVELKSDFGFEGNEALIVSDPTAPLSQGGIQLQDGSWLNWGAWAGDNVVTESNGAIDTNELLADNWLWVLGDTLLAPQVFAQSSDGLPRGSFVYSLAGGTPLYNTADGSVGGNLTSLDMLIDFSTLFVEVKLTTDITLIPTLESPSIATISDLYTGGIFLIDLQTGTTADGTLYGGLYGSQAAGAGVLLSLNDNDISTPSSYEGAFALERGNRADERVTYIVDNGESLSVNYIEYVGFETEGSGDSRIVRFIDDSLNGTKLAAFQDAVPVEFGGKQLADGTEVNWGVWAAIDYQLNESISLSDWHYMVSDNAILNGSDVSAMISDLGLTGSFQYDYSGGTTLSGSQGGSVDIQGGSFELDMASLAISGFVMQTDLGAFAADSAPTVSDFYSGTFGINNFGDSGTATGTLGGYAVGEMEGFVTDITINDSTESYFGTALWEQGAALSQAELPN